MPEIGLFGSEGGATDTRRPYPIWYYSVKSFLATRRIFLQDGRRGVGRPTLATQH